MFGETFGVTNGVITILALVVGMHSAGVDKPAMVSAMIALLISDPISDAYALYNAQTASTDATAKVDIEEEKDEARWVATKAFGAQATLQLILLASVVSAPNVTNGMWRCVIVGVILVIVFERVMKRPAYDTARNLGAIILLISITHSIESRILPNDARRMI